jgi:hypothetical protein
MSLMPQMLDLIHAYRGGNNVAVILALGVILALIVCISGRRLLIRAFRRLTRARLRFEPYQRSSVWFGAIADQRYLVSLKAVWKVTNSSRRDVVLKSFHVGGLATEHHMLFVAGGSHDADALVPARGSIDLEIFCMVQKTLTWGSGVFTADICLVDDRGGVRTIKNVRFNHLKQANSVETPTSYQTAQRRSPVVESA